MIGAVVQARVSSTRLPGKVMMEVLGKPLLQLLTERLAQCKYLDDIIIATTTNLADEPVQKLSERLSLKYMRGSEDDVLQRYYQAAEAFGLEHIVRITADCPLIDPEIVDRIIRVYIDSGYKYDYVSNALKPTFPDGLDVEIFSFSALEKINKLSDKKYQREHVCTYIIENPDQFHIHNVKGERDYSHFRWTVDNPEDFMLVKTIFERIYPEKPVFFMRDILALMEREPGLLQINSAIQRNEGFAASLDKDGLSNDEKNNIVQRVLDKKHINEI